MRATTLSIFITSISIIKSALDGFTEKCCQDYENKQDENHQAFSKDFCRTLSVEDRDNKCVISNMKKTKALIIIVMNLLKRNFITLKK